MSAPHVVLVQVDTCSAHGVSQGGLAVGSRYRAEQRAGALPHSKKGLTYPLWRRRLSVVEMVVRRRWCRSRGFPPNRFSGWSARMLWPRLGSWRLCAFLCRPAIGKKNNATPSPTCLINRNTKRVYFLPEYLHQLHAGYATLPPLQHWQHGCRPSRINCSPNLLPSLSTIQAPAVLSHLDIHRSTETRQL